MRAAAVADRQIDEPALLRLVDNLERDAGAPADAIEKRVAVTGLAHGAGRHGPDLGDAVPVHDLAESLERANRRVERMRPDGLERKRVAAEQDPLGCLLDHPRWLTRRQFGNGEPDRAGAHVEDAHDLWWARSIVHIEDQSSRGVADNTGRCGTAVGNRVTSG